MIAMPWKSSNEVARPRSSISEPMDRSTVRSMVRRKILPAGLICAWVLAGLPHRAVAQLLSGYSLINKHLSGPVQTQIATDPIWAVDYHTLALEYRGSGQIAAGASVLALRPGSVGP